MSCNGFPTGYNRQEGKAMKRKDPRTIDPSYQPKAELEEEVREDIPGHGNAPKEPHPIHGGTVRWIKPRSRR